MRGRALVELLAKESTSKKVNEEELLQEILQDAEKGEMVTFLLHTDTHTHSTVAGTICRSIRLDDARSKQPPATSHYR